MTKFLVYDLSKSRMGFGFTPLGFIVIPVAHLWTCEEINKGIYPRCDTYGQPLCPKFPTCPRFVAKYERKKNEWINAEKEQKTSHMQEQRFKMGEQLSRSNMFNEAPNQKQRRIIARNIFPQLTEGELTEIIEIAKMGISYRDMMNKVEEDKIDIGLAKGKKKPKPKPKPKKVVDKKSKEEEKRERERQREIEREKTERAKKLLREKNISVTKE